MEFVAVQYVARGVTNCWRNLNPEMKPSLSDELRRCVSVYVCNDSIAGVEIYVQSVFNKPHCK